MTFDPLPAGTQINFRVEPIFVGSDGLFHDTTDNDPSMQSFTGSLGISQFPMVPEPAALSAALIGAAGLVVRRRR